jgi:hypothetical protein
MWKRIGVVVLWILATLGTASITLAAVSRVGGEVTERPAVPVAGADLATTTIQRSTSAASGTAAPSGTAAVDPIAVIESTSTSAAVPVASSAPTNTTSPTTTIASPSPAGPSATPSSTTSTTTTTAPTPQPPVSTVLVGGTVTVQQTGNSVTLISAVPSLGFTAEIEKSGPSKVEVEFTSSSHESQYHAEIGGGVLDIDTEEHEKGED